MIKSRFTINSLEEWSEVMRAIAHPIRIAMIDLLREEKKLTVTEIYEELDIEQAVASHHLRILKDRDVLMAQRDGKNTYYFLKSPEFTVILSALQSL